MASLLSALISMSLVLAAGGALAQASTAANSDAASILSGKSPLPASTVQPLTPNTMMEPITPEARRKFIQTSLAQSPLSIRELINLMTYKVEAQPGLSWDDVITSMKQRANKINLKFIGAHLVHKEVEAITGKPTPKVEIYHFCDALLARESEVLTLLNDGTNQFFDPSYDLAAAPPRWQATRLSSLNFAI